LELEFLFQQELHTISAFIIAGADMSLVGKLFAVLLAVLLVTNAIVMLFSPAVWFRMPGWIAARGSLTAERYSSGWGSWQIRITGGMLLGFIGWVLYDMLIAKR
jgi:hypothetical protein